jgi:DNA-binding transcriptional regulator PaaX
MSSKNDYSKKILNILAEKPAVSMQSITENQNPKTSYALTRSMKNLVEAGCAELHKSDNKNYFKITKKGKTKLDTIRIEGEDALVPISWDGFWRIILLDLPEKRKNERESLRYLLKKAGFVCLKNSAWISPYPFEHLFANIKKDLGLTTEMMILVTNNIDDISRKAFMENFNK